MTNDTHFEPNPRNDRVIGSIFIILFALGTIGNILAFLYFWPNRRKSLPDKLYITIVSLDAVTCATTIPVLMSLFHGRDAMMFSSLVTCGSWTVIANFSLRMSMFLVVVLSVTRSVAIVWPHISKNIRTSRVVVVTSGYAAWLLVSEGIFLVLGWLLPRYRTDISSCNYIYSKEMPVWAQVFDSISVQIQIFVPSVIVLVSFLAGTLTLVRKRHYLLSSKDIIKKERSRFRQVSNTISIFSALFLVCNIPVFVEYSIRVLSYYIPSFDNRVGSVIYLRLGGYGELLLTYLPVILNAALNPCLYMLRMPRYQEAVLRWNQSLVRLARTAVRRAGEVCSAMFLRSGVDQG